MMVANSTNQAVPQPITWVKRLGRLIAGYLLGSVWSSFTCLFWLGLLLIGYGDVEEGLHLLMKEWFGFAAMILALATSMSSLAGGTIAPAVLGPTRLRYPIITSSFLGALASVLSTLMFLGLAVARELPRRSETSINLPFLVGIPLGLLTGWMVGRWLTKRFGS